MRIRVWVGIPASGDGPKRYANYFRSLRAAGLEPFCPDSAGTVPAMGTGPAGGNGTSEGNRTTVSDGNRTSAGEPSSGEVKSADCEALLLPGGGDLDPSLYGQPNTASVNLEPDRDALEWDLLNGFLRDGKPVLGICRGMQSLNVFLGGTLLQDIPGHSRVGGQDRMHPVRTAPGPLADLFRTACLLTDGGGLTVNSAHHQAADRLGAGLTAAQYGPDGVVEAVVHRTLPVWGVQWHPERMLDGTGKALFRGFAALCERNGGGGVK